MFWHLVETYLIWGACMATAMIVFSADVKADMRVWWDWPCTWFIYFIAWPYIIYLIERK